jgi:hypothetical protein
MLPRWRHEIGQPVQEVKRRYFDDAVGARQQSEAVDVDHGQLVWAADHGQSLACEGGPGKAWCWAGRQEDLAHEPPVTAAMAEKVPLTGLPLKHCP